MKISKKFNQLAPSAYKYYIDNYKKYTDFNTLGLYRSILENDRLHLDDKIKIRDYANLTFGKTFYFYQLKDPFTYFKLISLGKELTKADENQLWQDIQQNQQQILKDKRIKHRNFGCYSKHDCGIDSCSMNGIMVRQGSRLAEHHLYFESDKNTYSRKEKSIRHRKNRKQKHKIIAEAQE
jgi:MFS superfamily sulfate permease-like transporter